MPLRTQTSGPRLTTDACPRCGSEEIRKLSLIHQTGLPTNTERKPAHEMALAKQAAPPTRKPTVMWAVAAAVFVAVALATLSTSAVMTTIAFGSVAVAIGFTARAMTYNSMVFPRLQEQWERSCMCNRCGTVFVQ